jgi:hypothetical protein
MGRVFRAIAFWIALTVSVALLLAVITAAVWAYVYVETQPAASGEGHTLSLAMTYGILLIVTGIIFLGIFFGWRQERRDAYALRQQTDNLQRDIRELERKIAAGRVQP